MIRLFNVLPAVILTAAVTLTPVGIAFAEAPSPTLTEADALGTYSTLAKRVSYTGELAEFSVDIPDGLSTAPSDSEVKEVGDGSTQWELFYGEDSTLYIDCCFHQKEGGYAGEMSAWRQSLEDGSLDMDIFGGSDLDGTEYSVVDLRYAYSEDDGTEILIGEYPWGEDTWVNVSVSGSTADMNSLREDICVMLGTFSRNAGFSAGISDDAILAADEKNSEEAADQIKVSNPTTAVAAPVTAAFAAVGAAAAMAVSAGKFKRK